MPAAARATLLAHHLYDFAECEHRVALDARLDRSERTPPDAATALLFEHGRVFERSVVAPLGYPRVEVEDGDWNRAAARTAALMRDGVPGIDQAVLLAPGRLAQPDLLERAGGASGLGGFHYVPGDVKSALSPRSDAALQVGFAALLLEGVQGVRPSSGFLVLGDGRRETIDLESIRATIDDAVARAEAVVRGEAETFPFFGPGCGRCRWRGRCLPDLQNGRDVSFVHGLTRTRHRVLRRHGIATIDDLARADLGKLAAEGVAADGLDRAQAQARALLEGRVLRGRAVPLPGRSGRGTFLRIETDPLDAAAPFLVCWSAGSDAVVRIVGSGEAADVARAAVAALSSGAEPIASYGARTTRGLEALCDLAELSPAASGDLLGRIVDLAPWVRRAGVLPVFRYAFAEVAAVALGTPRPEFGGSEDDLFVLHAALLATGDPEAESALEAAGRASLASLAAIRAWLSGAR